MVLSYDILESPEAFDFFVHLGLKVWEVHVYELIRCVVKFSLDIQFYSHGCSRRQLHVA